MTIYTADLYFSHLIQRIESPFLEAYLSFISTIGNFFPLYAILSLATLYFYFTKHKRAALYLFFGTSVGVLFSTILKLVVSRPRPTADLVNVLVNLTDFSFPSSHCVSFTVMFGFMYYYLTIHNKNHSSITILTRILLILLILSVGISRIYLGAHWITDCLAGYALGALVLLVTIKLFKNER